MPVHQGVTLGEASKATFPLRGGAFLFDRGECGGGEKCHHL